MVPVSVLLVEDNEDILANLYIATGFPASAAALSSAFFPEISGVSFTVAAFSPLFPDGTSAETAENPKNSVSSRKKVAFILKYPVIEI